MLTKAKELVRWAWHYHPTATIAAALGLALVLGLAVAALTKPGPTTASLRRGQRRTAKEAVADHLAAIGRDTLAAAKYDTLAVRTHRTAQAHHRRADSLHTLTHSKHVLPPRPITSAAQRRADELLSKY